MYSVVLPLLEHSLSSRQQQRWDNILCQMVLQNRLCCHYATWIRSEIWLQKRSETIDSRKRLLKKFAGAGSYWATRKAFLADEFHSDASKHCTFSATSLWPIFWTPSAVRTKSELTLQCNKTAKWGRPFHTKHTPSCNVRLPASDCLLSAPQVTTAFSANILTKHFLIPNLLS